MVHQSARRSVQSSGGDLAPSFGGRKMFSRIKISELRFFREKIPFSRPKFLMTFFQSLTRFSGFYLSFHRFSVSFTMLNVVYDPFLTRTTTISEKNSFMTPFFSVHTFARIRQHYFSKYWGRMHGPSPTSNFFEGPSPQSPLGFRLWYSPGTTNR